MWFNLSSLGNSPHPNPFPCNVIIQKHVDLKENIKGNAWTTASLEITFCLCWHTILLSCFKDVILVVCLNRKHTFLVKCNKTLWYSRVVTVDKYNNIRSFNKQTYYLLLCLLLLWWRTQRFNQWVYNVHCHVTSYVSTIGLENVINYGLAKIK